MIALTIMLTAAFTFGLSYFFFAYLIKRDNKRKKKLREAEKTKTNELISYLISRVQTAESLNEVYILHIQIWANGIYHPNFGPNKYGMFRTKNILLMRKEEVFLGNIWGLNTKSLPFWEKQDEQTQTIVLNQYKNQLISNLKTLIK